MNLVRRRATLGPTLRRSAIEADCLLCRDLERAYEARRDEYIEARCSACFRLYTELAAGKNVEMERARYELEEHRLVCASTSTKCGPLPELRVAVAGIAQAEPLSLPRPSPRLGATLGSLVTMAHR